MNDPNLNILFLLAGKIQACVAAQLTTNFEKPSVSSFSKA